MQYDPPIIIEPKFTADAAVIWLHGLGADGGDFEPLVPQLGTVVNATRFVFPHAPQQAVTINGGMEMRAWYDIYEANLVRRVDAAGVTQSANYLHELITAEINKGICAARIVLAGFSQGGAIALHAGIQSNERLAGILALSTYLPMLEDSKDLLAKDAPQAPIFLAHGSQDPVVPLALSQQTLEVLDAHGFAVQCHTYPIAHSVSAEEVRDIGHWLQRILPPQQTERAMAEP